MMSDLPWCAHLLVAIGLDGDLVFYAVILLVTVLGGILQKKKAGQDDSADKHRPGSRDHRQGLPAPPRRVEPPVVTPSSADSGPPKARPVGAPPTRGREPAKVALPSRPGRPDVSRPVARSDRDVRSVLAGESDVPGRAPARETAQAGGTPMVPGTGGRPHRRASETRRRSTSVAKHAGAAEIEAAADHEEDRVEIEREGYVAAMRAELEHLPVPLPGDDAAYPTRGTTAYRLRMALGSPAGLRTAVVLSEILAPPMALRDQH